MNMYKKINFEKTKNSIAIIFSQITKEKYSTTYQTPIHTFRDISHYFFVPNVKYQNFCIFRKVKI